MGRKKKKLHKIGKGNCSTRYTDINVGTQETKEQGTRHPEKVQKFPSNKPQRK
jgi:hypothetical protein